MRPRLLLIEPDAGLRGDLEACLARAGYAVHSPESLDAAIAPGLAVDAAIAAVVGREQQAALTRLAHALAPAPVIALCTELTPELALALRQRGAAACLRTPFASSALLELLASLLRARRARPEEPEPRSPQMQSLLRHADALARSRAALLLVGEHGSGRRWLARRIHACGAFATATFAAVDASDWLDETAAAAPAADVAPSRLAAAWGAARGGTLALSSLSELTPTLQRELLELLRVESSADAPRLIACARGSLQSVASSLLPALWLRLSGAALELPPLRERGEDLAALARHFLARAAALRGATPPELDAAAVAALRQHPFRGNLAELENLMLRAVITTAGPRVDVASLLDPKLRRAAPPPRDSLDLRVLERQTIERALAAAGGNRTHASRALGISVRTLRNKLHRYGTIAPD